MRYATAQMVGRMARRRMCVLSFVAVLGFGSSTIASLNAQTLTWLGTLGGSESFAFRITGNGAVVIGESSLPNGDSHAFRWSQNTGMVPLGTLGGGYSTAASISMDGSIIVRQSQYTNGDYLPVYWSGTSIGALPTLGGNHGAATGITIDGTVIVGWTTDSSGGIAVGL